MRQVRVDVAGVLSTRRAVQCLLALRGCVRGFRGLRCGSGTRGGTRLSVPLNPLVVQRAIRKRDATAMSSTLDGGKDALPRFSVAAAVGSGRFRGKPVGQVRLPEPKTLEPSFGEERRVRER